MSDTKRTPDAVYDPVPTLVSELGLPRAGIVAVLALLDEGATVPFIARYRKEATGGLDEVQIRNIEERRAYLVELEERRRSIRTEIDKQGKLDDALARRIAGCTTKAELEDLYLPYKPKRRTRAIIARERGLEPLADRIWSQAGEGAPAAEAARFVDAAREVADADAALAGARDICAERIAELAEVRQLVRGAYAAEGVIRTGKTKDFADKATKFDMYASFEEKVRTIPSHRFLAIRRGEVEGVLTAALEIDGDRLLPIIERSAGVKPSSPWAAELKKAASDAYRRLLATPVAVDVRVDLKAAADRDAVDVFAQNLRELLLSAPYGSRSVLGIDPGQRTGCKCAVVDATGKLLEHVTIYLVQGDGARDLARGTLRELVRKHAVSAVAVGNGTHGRETEAFARQTLSDAGQRDVPVVSVSEAGASVYSASDVAREEFPDLDLTVRGAVSIARRLQDPLAELVKIDPKSIGVGQYQHDVQQTLLARKLDEVVESCVNAVGVELNTASAPLLARVSGIGPTLARRIVAHRDERGAFRGRQGLLEVSGVGKRTFEQSAGFLRIRGGAHPLDASAVHPERYGLVETMARDLGVPVASLVGDADAVARIDARRYLESGGPAAAGEFTLRDILAELKKPGRDPRATFAPPKFRDDVRTMEDLRPGMELEGVVTNVTAFGAFVDVGVHQDGLVHVSQLADRFVKAPSDVVKVGDKLTVRVLEIDLARQRIALSARKGGAPAPGGSAAGAQPPPARGGGERPRGDRPAAKAPPQPAAPEKFANNPFARHFDKRRG
ncbi:MAG: Tex family protein [Polyangiaceae bacterium]